MGAALVAMGVRLGSSLVLTRLLFPAAFGLSAMVVTVITGLVMISDLGIAPAVIRSPRGEDPGFLRTAYSLQVLRASALALIAAALGVPMAHLMREPLMVSLMPCGALVLWIHGFCSMRTLILRRKLRVLPLIGLELGSQILGALVMIGAARAGWGVWSLVWGAVASAVASTAVSFRLPCTYREGFAWDAAARSEIVHFGRWILFSSALTFASARGDQFVFGRLLGASGLGYYNVAFALAEAAEGVATRVSGSVIYPVFAELHNREPGALRRAYYATRLPFDALSHVALGGLCALSGFLIELLYDPRYQAVTPMLQALSVRASLGLWASACEVALMAQGLSVVQFQRNAAVTLGVLVCMPAGFWLSGASGLIWGTVVARLCAFAALWPRAQERGLLAPVRELWVPLCFGAGYALGAILDRVLAGL